jgi:hypothetical protein
MQILLNHPYNLDQIVEAMKQHFSGHNTQHNIIAKRYFDSVSESLIEGIKLARGDQLQSESSPIDWNRLRQQVGRYGHQQFWLDWFHEHYPLVKIISKGNNFKKERTIVEPLYCPEWQEQVEDILTPKELFEYNFRDHLDNWRKDNFFYTEINLKSLRNYISKTERTRDSMSQAQQRTADQNLHLARKIERIVLMVNQLHEFDPTNYPKNHLPQHIRESEFGRQYLGGINLQTAHKEIRHAALGTCYEYDIENSVYSWRLSLIRQVDPQGQYPTTLEYIDHKQAIRRKLANEVFGETGSENWRIDIIKQCLAAIGFGARTTTSAWRDQNDRWQRTSLRELLKAQYFVNFMTNPWVREFLNEQDCISGRLFAYFKVNYADIIAQNPKLRNENNPNQLHRNRCLSFFYQQYERAIMEGIKTCCDSDNILLLCHDAIYTKRPINIISVKEYLGQYNYYAQISKQRHFVWNDTDISDLEHRANILQEERQANNGRVPEKVIKNNQKILKMFQHRSHRLDHKEFYTNYSDEPRYDPDLDPWYDNEQKISTAIATS